MENTKQQSTETKKTIQTSKDSVVKKALKKVFSDKLFLFLAVSSAFNVLLLYYFVFLQTTTFSIFWDSNTTFYNIASLVMTLAIGALFAIVVSFLAWQARYKLKNGGSASGSTFMGAFFGAVSTGCPVCGAFLVSMLGIGGGLAAFPLQGLEIKALALFLLGYSVFLGSKNIASDKCEKCETPKEKRLIAFEKDHVVFNINKETLSPLKPTFVVVGSFVLLLALPVANAKLDLGVSFQKNSFSNFSATEQTSNTPSSGGSSQQSENISASSLLEKVNPKEGYEINATWGDIGPKLLAAGAIDLDKFKSIYKRAGQPLTEKQLKILTEGSDEKIVINRDNAYFMINVLWALGLTNKNPILEKGPLSKYSSNIGYFASTGGWTVGKRPATELYSSSPIITLTQKQQKELEEFANNSYRPCCNNSTAFADCNHGMAALALGEIMAANGATADDMFEALKYFNAFWFPQQYMDLAKYFQIREGKDWEDVDPRIVMGKNYSTASGWSRVRNWLASNNAQEKLPIRGGGCGV